MEEVEPWGISGIGAEASEMAAEGVRRGSRRRMSRRNSAMGSVECGIRSSMCERADVEIEMAKLSS